MAVPTLTAHWTAKDTPELHVGAGVADQVGECVAALGVRRPLVVSDQGVAGAGWSGRVSAALLAAGLAPVTWLGVRSNPDTAVVHACRDELAGHDGVVAVGGGSVIDVAKAASGLAAHGGRLPDYAGLGRFTTPGVPVIAVLTTPGSGAELSRHAVIADDAGRKYAVSGRWLAPRLVLADPDTLATVPATVATDTVLDALLHAIEAYLARAATPYSDVCARIAASTLGAAAVPALREHDAAARADLVSGCLAAGMAMSNTNAGVVHALGYPLTSEYDIPHGRANALVAPTTLRVLAATLPARCAELGHLLGGTAEPDSLATAFAGIRRRLGVPASLAEYGVPETDLPRLAGLATAYQPVLRNTCREFTEAQLCELYQAAWKAEPAEQREAGGP